MRIPVEIGGGFWSDRGPRCDFCGELERGLEQGLEQEFEQELGRGLGKLEVDLEQTKANLRQT